MGEILQRNNDELELRIWKITEFLPNIHAHRIEKTNDLITVKVEDLACFQPFAVYYCTCNCVRIPYYILKYVLIFNFKNLFVDVR